jgi:hypothetical protein
MGSMSESNWIFPTSDDSFTESVMAVKPVAIGSESPDFVPSHLRGFEGLAAPFRFTFFGLSSTFFGLELVFLVVDFTAGDDGSFCGVVAGRGFTDVLFGGGVDLPPLLRCGPTRLLDDASVPPIPNPIAVLARPWGLGLLSCPCTTTFSASEEFVR